MNMLCGKNYFRSTYSYSNPDSEIKAKKGVFIFRISRQNNFELKRMKKPQRVN
jgi:hypothetical protein